MRELQIHPLAEAELAEATRFYEDRLPGLGEVFLAEVARCFEHAYDTPDLGAPCYGSFRRLLVRRFPYTVVYEILPQAILIVAVAHQKRKPGYWRRRS
ncbi:MAG: type II toxin-antitoxin system RelE/ParE family toxin [Desulfomonilaceae bacterium]